MGIFLLAADNEEVDQQWIEQEREASAAIARLFNDTSRTGCR
jgi:hypothetical protein